MTSNASEKSRKSRSRECSTDRGQILTI